MIIDALTLQNLRGVRDPVRIDLKASTSLLGPHNAGTGLQG